MSSESNRPNSTDSGSEPAPGRERVSLLERFPGLRRLRAFRQHRSVPFVRQLAATECGAACLAMTLGYHGKAVRLEEVRELTGPGRDGATALAIMNAARWFGLRGRGVKLEIEDLEYLEPGSILHWEFRHFVVFEDLHEDAVDLVDPAAGRRRVTMEQFRRSFTGVALLFEPSDEFQPQAGERRH